MFKSDTLKVAPSPQDDRDWIWQAMGNFPPTLSLDYRSELLPVRNQVTEIVKVLVLLLRPHV